VPHSPIRIVRFRGFFSSFALKFQLKLERASLAVVGPPDERRPPLAVAMEWSSRVFAVALEMILPGLGGQWLDRRWGTSFLALLGFALGVSLGIWHLLVMSRQDGRGGKGRDKSQLPQ